MTWRGASALALLGIAASGWYLTRETRPAFSTEAPPAPMPLATETTRATPPSSKTRRAEAPKSSPGTEPLTLAFAKFQTGDYDGAVQILRVQFNRNSGDDLLRRNLGTSLYALGLQRLKEQKMTSAEDLFEESAGLGHKGAAAALANLKVRSGKHDAALAVLEDVFEKSHDVFALRSLVDLALSRDDLHRAQAYLNRGESIQPTSPEEGKLLDQTLDERRRRLEVRRVFAQSEIVVDRGQVQVAYMSPEKKRTAEAVARSLEETLERLITWLSPLPDQVRIRAVVVPGESFLDSTGAPPWAQGIYDGILRIPVARGEPSGNEIARASAVSRHEMLHAFLYELCGDVFPYWLNEGLAQKVDGRPLSAAANTLKQIYGSRLPETMATDGGLETSFVDAPSGSIDELYARSLLLVDAITRRHGNDVWRTLVTRTCVEKEPLSQVLTAELGASQGIDLWKIHFSKSGVTP